MIEKTLFEYYTEKFTGIIPVYMAFPEPAPPRFFLIEKTGGSRENQICYATVAVQSYGVSVADAAHMNLMAISAMYDALELDTITNVILNSDYNFPDTTRKRHRYQAVFNLTHYEME